MNYNSSLRHSILLEVNVNTICPQLQAKGQRIVEVSALATFATVTFMNVSFLPSKYPKYLYSFVRSTP